METFYTKQEMAKILSIAVRTLEAWTLQGKIPFYKFGKAGQCAIRYRETEVEAALAKHRVKEKA